LVANGVARADFDARSDGTPYTVSVSFPAQADGSPKPGAKPGVVLIPGGLVDYGHYLWLADALAARGYVVGVPEEPHDLAALDTNRTEGTRALLRSNRGLLANLVNTHIAVMGHSLGAVVAAQGAVDGQFGALVLLAGYAADSDDVEGLTIPSLSLAGRADCDAKLADVQKGWERLPSPTFLVVVDGMTHYQFTDSQAQDEGKCTPGISLDQAHATIASTVGDFLDGAIGGTPNAWLDLSSNADGGVEVSQR
jgi:pimeloyl-ACP methyl ester carboxylesterase